MRRASFLAAGALALLAATPAIPERSDVDMYATLRPSILSPAPVMLQRFNARGDIVALVDKVADQTGVPRHVLHEHVKRESGYQPSARNPKSTAKGLTQPVRCSHAVIIGRDCRTFTKSEHFRLASDPSHNLRVGAAHIRACMALMPGASARELWRNCHVKGHGAVGGNIQMAAAYFKPNAGGWLTQGSVAMPWANNDVRSGG
jgi:hypothetical protein